MTENESLIPPSLIIGGNGLVGSKIVELINPQVNHLFVPTSQELDITNLKSIDNYLLKIHPQIVINFAAHTNLEEAEKQRGDRESLSWQINVIGAQNVAKAAKRRNIYLIHISTDAVFPGTDDFPGPYSENSIPPDNLDNLCWYGYTKLKGEQAVQKTTNKFAIVRISYPFGNPLADKDFAKKTLKYIQSGYPLFSDQFFTPTYIPDLSLALIRILQQEMTGYYHVACQGLTTPYEFGSYLASQTGLKKNIKSGSVVEFIKTPCQPTRAMKGGLLTYKTINTQGIKFHTWQAAVDSYIQNN